MSACADPLESQLQQPEQPEGDPSKAVPTSSSRPLQNVRQERFAQFVASGDTQLNAYTKAGYDVKSTAARFNASRLAARPDIAKRIRDIRLNHSNHATIDKAWIGEKLVLIVDTDENAMAKCRALELLGKMIGIEGFTTTNVRHIRNPSEMSSSELKQLIDNARQLGYQSGRADAVNQKQLPPGDVIDAPVDDDAQ